MAITGGIKFFEPNKNLVANGASGVASSGTAAADFALDRNDITRWRSSGSNDSTTETFEVTFPAAVTIDRILLLDHNLKDFKIEYDLIGVFTAFTGVIGLDGALSGIVETAFADNTSYYEFDAVTTTKILITMNTTQTVDAEKFLTQIISTEELGTLEGYPLIKGFEFNRNIKKHKMLSQRSIIDKGARSMKGQLDFRNYPTSIPSDANLMDNLFDRDDPFMVWLCGGRRGTDFFRVTLRGFRLKDIFTMDYEKAIKPAYTNNTYTNLINLRAQLTEVV